MLQRANFDTDICRADFRHFFATGTSAVSRAGSMLWQIDCCGRAGVEPNADQSCKAFMAFARLMGTDPPGYANSMTVHDHVRCAVFGHAFTHSDT